MTDIRPLHPDTDLPAVAAFLQEAADYWILADGEAPGPTAAQDFFTDCPPNCDPAQSHHLGLFVDGKLSGLAELSFGFPNPGDAYLGLMILSTSPCWRPMPVAGPSGNAKASRPPASAGWTMTMG